MLYIESRRFERLIEEQTKLVKMMISSDPEFLYHKEGTHDDTSILLFVLDVNEPVISFEININLHFFPINLIAMTSIGSRSVFCLSFFLRRMRIASPLGNAII